MPKKLLRAKVRIGTKEDGKPLYKWISAYSRRDLNAARKQVEQEAALASERAAEPVKPSSPTFREYAKEWYKLYKKPNIQPGTQYSYNYIFNNHIYPEFGDMQIDKITSNDIQRFIIEYDERSSSLIAKIMQNLNQVFRFALADDIILKSPMVKVKPPKGIAKERKPLSVEEVQLLVKETEGHPDGFLPLLVLFTGMRRGEALGLRWEDIGEDYLNVRRTCAFDENDPYLKEPKSKAGIRAIPIDMIKSYLPPRGEGYVFGGDSLWTKSKYRRTWDRLSEDIPILKEGTAHVLRHTYTMLLRRAGVDAVSAQYILGHEDYAVTANIYTHIDKNDLTEATDKLKKYMESLATFTATK